MTKNNKTKHALPPTPPHRPLAILSMGMVSAVGGDVDSTCAAMRARFNNHKETDFRDASHNPIIGSRTPVDPSLFGDARLVEMMVQALEQFNVKLTPELCATVPCGLCTPEPARLGRSANDAALLRRLETRLGIRFQAKDSSPLPYGHVSGLLGLQAAQVMLYERNYPYVLLLAADSMLNGDALADLDARGHLLTLTNGQGLIPGEAAVALLLTRPSANVAMPVVDGLGLSGIAMPTPPARPSPMGGRELATAIYNACAQAQCHPAEIELSLADCNGVSARFEETALAESIVFKDNHGPTPHQWLAAECLGDLGAAASLAAIVWACHAARKGYLPGHAASHRVLVHASNGIPHHGIAARGAAVLRF